MGAGSDQDVWRSKESGQQKDHGPTKNAAEAKKSDDDHCTSAVTHGLLKSIPSNGVRF